METRYFTFKKVGNTVFLLGVFRDLKCVFLGLHYVQVCNVMQHVSL